MAETLSLNLRGPGIPPTSFTYQKIESFSSPYQEVEWFSSPRSNPTGNGTPEMFRTKPPGSVFVFTVPPHRWFLRGHTAAHSSEKDRHCLPRHAGTGRLN